MNDNVNNPKHYCVGNLECIDIMEIVFGVEAVKWFCILNAFKYLFRFPRKNGIEDIKKSAWYLQRYIKITEEHEDNE